jgi:hypothetical protein
VKRFRVFILVLLTLLLPIRGAMAAAMLCPDGERSTQTAVVATHGHHGAQPMEHHSSHEAHTDGSSAHHHAGADAAADTAPSGEHPATCHFCASGCCMVSLLGTAPSLERPRVISWVAFPELVAPLPVFQSGGQDRPPRTI